MEYYQLRVVKERDQLKIKFDSLMAFLDNKSKMKVIKFKDGWLLFMQAFCMARYLNVLDKRIKNFNK
jgi:hypothetical protein